MAVRFTQNPRPDGGETLVPAGILPVVLIYAVFSALWIISSDKAVELLFSDPAHITLASTLKGWLFVVVTSIMLYGLMRRLVIGCDQPATPSPAAPRPLLLPMVLLIAAIVLITAGEITHSVIHQKESEEAVLHTVADLKASQVTDWLAERHADAQFVQLSMSWFDLYRRWRETGDPASLEQLQGQLLRFRHSNEFQGILLLDEDGKPLWNSESAELSVDPALAAPLEQSGATGGIIRLGPYRDQGGRLHIDFIVPLSGGDRKPPPVVVLYADPAHYLLPTLQAWPTPSSTGEIMLFRAEGGQVFCLKEQCARAIAAKPPGLPEKRLLTAQVLSGEARLDSLIEGVDYRGVPVMGVALSIPDTDWFLVAKLDKSEFYQKCYLSVFWIALTGMLALFMAVAGILIFRQRQELAASLCLGEIQADRLRALALLDSIAEGSEDAIFAKDTEGRYLLFNQAAVRVTGKKVEEVLGRDDRAIFPPEEAEMLMALGRRVMDEDRTMTDEEYLTTVDGKFTFLATKGPLHDVDGKVTGLFGISRDITERKKMEDDLRDSLAEKVALLKEVHHRVKNNLQIVASLLTLQADRTPDPNVVDVLHDTRNRVRSIALLHEVLYRSGNLARIDFPAYVREICTQLQRSFGQAGARVRLEENVAAIGLSLEQAMPCGLIISELVTNALKHGFPGGRSGRVTVELDHAAGQQLVLCVRDDGVGLPPDFDPAATTTLGLQLVVNLSGQLGGSMETSRGPEGGAVFRVLFPELPKEIPPGGKL
ncbi:MAG: PAS domain-containing protein [Deltaproteobacteria bacterium]|nr:PAS domain-containing protein [Deltaproteobacteria bacterium]